MENKKITLKEFIKSHEKLAIHCKNWEESQKLCDALEEWDKKWYGTSKFNVNPWIYGRMPDGYYYLTNNLYTTKGWCLKHNYKIYELEEVEL